MAKVPNAWHRNIAENFNCLSRAHKHCRQATDDSSAVLLRSCLGALEFLEGKLDCWNRIFGR